MPPERPSPDPAVAVPSPVWGASSHAPPALMAAALAQLAEGVVVTDAAGRITFVNEAAARLHGVARLDVAPEQYAETYHLLTEDGRPYPSTELPLARAVLRGETVLEARWRIRRPDGTEVLAIGSARPVLGPDGRQAGAVLTLRDDTAREAAAAAERRAVRVLEQISDAHVTLDHAFRFVTVNPAAERMLGMRRDAMLGRTHWDVFPASVGAEPERQYRRVQAEGVEAHFTHHYVGEGYDVHLEIDAYPTEGGAAGRGVAVFWRDVGDRVRGRVALEIERARLAQVFQQAPVAVVVLRGRRAADLVFELTNPPYEAMIPAGRAPLGRRLEDAVPEVATAMGPIIQQVLDTGEPFVASDYCVPLDRDGDGAPEDYFFSFVYHPLLGADASVDGIVGVGTEVTESVLARRRAEALAEQLRESEARVREQARQLRTLAENATLALFVMDEHQRCTFMNPAAERLTGYTLDELEGKALHYYVHHTRPDGTPYPLEECPIDQAFPQNMREQGTEVFVHRDGSFYEVAFTASPIREGERTVGTIIEVRDIREERTRERERERLLEAERGARAEAERANQAKSHFLATMSHELRTPLNAIGGYAELLELGIRGPVTPAQREDLERIQRSQRHLLSLINEVLNYARLESGAVKYDVRPTPVADVVTAVAPLVEPQRLAKGIGLEVRVPEEGAGRPPRLVMADREKLQQILLNLLSNAVKFTPAGGRITVALDSCPDAHGRAVLCVSDTGLGIPADRLEDIFEPFVQVGRTHSNPAEGTGLGLAISRDLARGMGGDLTAESTVGAGSTFTLSLPAA
jgi:PAS domain S-box-containing protein